MLCESNKILEFKTGNLIDRFLFTELITDEALKLKVISSKTPKLSPTTKILFSLLETSISVIEIVSDVLRFRDTVSDIVEC